MNADKAPKKKGSKYSNHYIDFFEFCIDENEEYYDWKRSQDIRQCTDEDWDNPDFLSINGRRL